MLPMSMVLLQAIVPLVLRTSHKTGPELLPSSLSGEGFKDMTEASSYHPASMTLLAEGVEWLGTLAFLLVAAWRRPGATVVTAIVQTPGCVGRAVVTQAALVLPALFYFLSNVLALHALSQLRSSVFSAIMNSRIIFAAFFSIPVLHKHLNGGQWRAILILVCAAAMLCLDDHHDDSNFTLHQESIGMFLAVATALVSAVAGMLAEKCLNADGGDEASPGAVVPRTDSDIDSSSSKPMDQSSLLWEQQAVLAFFSAVFAVVFVFIFHPDTLQAGQFFRGWDGTIVFLTLLSAAQGLVVAITIQRCGVLTRLILGSVAMCLCKLLEGLLFSNSVAFQDLLAVVMVVVGANLYFTAGSPSSSFSSSSTSSSYQPLQGRPEVRQRGDGGNRGETKGKEVVYKEGKHETRLSSSGFPSLRVAFPFKNAADNSTSLKRLTAVMVLGLVYISASSYVSVMLASKGLMEGSKAEGEAAAAVAMLHSMTQESDRDRELVDGAGAAAVLVQAEEEEEEDEEDKDKEEDEKLLLAPSVDATKAKEGEEGEDKEDGVSSSVSMASVSGMSEELRESYFSSFLKDLSSSDDGLLKAAAITLAKKTKSGACNLEKDKVPDPWNPNDGVRRDIGLCMQIKNDAGIIDEHIAFHWAQGVRKFIIYDDGSEDNPWSVLEKYVGLGIVEYHDMTGHWRATSVEHQLDNMNECLTTFRERGPEEGVRWVVFADLDEFVLSSVPGETLSDTLNDKYKGWACLQIARTWYGSSYRHQKPTGLVTETYLLASPDHADGYPKLIANILPENRTRNVTRLYSIHDFADQGEIPCILKNDIKDVRINHYLRSLEEYDKKALFGPSQQEKYTQPLKKFFDRDRNTHLSLVASAYACEVHALLAQMEEMQNEGKIPAVVRPKAWNETHTK